MSRLDRIADFARRVFDPREQPPELEIETALDCAAVGGALGLLFGAAFVAITYWPSFY